MGELTILLEQCVFIEQVLCEGPVQEMNEVVFQRFYLSGILGSKKQSRSWAKRWQEDFFLSLENMMIKNRYQLSFEFFLCWTTKLPRNEDSQMVTHTSASHSHPNQAQHLSDSNADDITSNRNPLLMWNATVYEGTKKRRGYSCDTF